MADRKTVLVIDDEPDTVVYFTSLLEDNGYDVISAENGEQARLKVNEIIPDLITLDVSMPEMSGVKFYECMRGDEKYRDIPIIFITGVSHDFESFHITRSQAPDGFFSKPIDQKKLLNLIESLIG